jgi:glycosyltransferase involved in cell wall biosynthesis
MVTIAKGSFSLDLGIVKLGTELSDDDRQCAWELYTEISTRVALTGKLNDSECKNFEGELYIESLDSLYKFFQEARHIMRKFPVGKIAVQNKNHLGVVISRCMDNVLRPFLEKWHVDYRHWWEYVSNPRLLPFERQKGYPKLDDLLKDWCDLRLIIRELQKELIRVYSLVDVTAR